MSALMLHAFAGYGIELEYMIVDRQTLSALPVADELLRRVADCEADSKPGRFCWSNEVALHVVELKNVRPDPSLEPLSRDFQEEIRNVNRLLDPMGARLMPTAMHPWMDPVTETRLWSRSDAQIYQAFDRIFGCKAHGWANIQAMHLNLPFAGDDEFTRLHAAIRLVLPIIPALAASSPITEGRPAGFMDFRIEAYRAHQAKIPSTIGRMIPDTVGSCADYRATILEPMFRDIAALDPDGVLKHDWLNVRGACPRFDRSAIEIRVIDMQECLQANLAIAAAITAVVRSIYDAKSSPLSAQQATGTDNLVDVLEACIRDAELAVIDDATYLQLLGFPRRQCQAGELWRHLIEMTELGGSAHWGEPLRVVLEYGPRARRILRAVGTECSKARLKAVYRELCECLEEGRMFLSP